MKSYITTILILITSTFISAQLNGVGFSLGGNSANLKAPEEMDNFDSDSNLGGGGGLRLDYKIMDEYVMFSPELFILEKGSDEFIDNLSDINLGQLNLTYFGMNLPISLYAPMGFESEDVYNGVFLQGKFYFDYYLTGSQSMNSEERKIQFEGNGDKFEFGYTIEGGLIYQGLQILAGYNVGIKDFEIINAFDNSNTLYSVNNKGLYFALGYVVKIPDDSYD